MEIATPDSSVRPRLIVIVPVYNEVDVIPLFFARLRPVVNQLNTQCDVIVVFANNASTDGSLDAVLSLRALHPFVYVVTTSRNVGYQRSLENALRVVAGDLFVFIDVDCEDPPEMIIDFLQIHLQGFDIVYGERTTRSEPAPLQFLRRLFYRITKLLGDDEVVLDMAEFSLITDEVRRAILLDSSSFPFIRASVGRVGFRRKGVPYHRGPRIAGESHYNLWRLAVFAIAGVLSSTTIFLRVPIYLLPVWLATLFVLTVCHAVAPSNAILAVIITLGFAYCGVVLAFIALYSARVYKNTLDRPNAFVDARCTILPLDR